MNLALHGLSGEIALGNSYYDDLHHSAGAFDFVMANPPFNVDGVDPAKVADDPRFPFGLPLNKDGTMKGANYLWIQSFLSSLSDNGRAGFVMANSAGDARDSELDIRKELISSSVVDVLVSVAPKMFFTVSLPVTLWFFDKRKLNGPRSDEVLFIDARKIFTEIDRAHREWSAAEVEFLANIVRLWRGLEPEDAADSSTQLAEYFPDGAYQDVLGLCGSASLADIEAQGWSLNPGRYVGIEVLEVDDAEFVERMAALRGEWAQLSSAAGELETSVVSFIEASSG